MMEEARVEKETAERLAKGEEGELSEEALRSIFDEFEAALSRKSQEE